MPTAQGFQTVDTGLYGALQSAKGTAGSAFKGGMGVTAFDFIPVKNKIEGEAFMGAGYWRRKGLGFGVLVNWTASGWVNVSASGWLLSLIGLKGTTTGANPYTHPYTFAQRNATKKYHTLSVIFGESATGIGIQPNLIRDVVVTSMTLTITASAAIQWQMAGVGLNYGPGAGTETYSFDATDFIIPNPSHASNTITLPTFFNSDVCVQSLQMAYNTQAEQGDRCIGPNGEYPDTIIRLAWFDIAVTTQGDANSVLAFNMVNALTSTPAANTSALKPGLKEGPLSLLVNSDEFVTGATPYSLAASFPSVQWNSAVWSNSNPNTINFSGTSFAGDATFTSVNGKISAAQTL